MTLLLRTYRSSFFFFKNDLVKAWVGPILMLMHISSHIIEPLFYSVVELCSCSDVHDNQPLGAHWNNYLDRDEHTTSSTGVQVRVHWHTVYCSAARCPWIQCGSGGLQDLIINDNRNRISTLEQSSSNYSIGPGLCAIARIPKFPH